MRLIRTAAFVAALITASVGVFSTVKDVIQARDARAQLAQERAYETIVDDVGRQQRLLVSTTSGGAATALALDRLTTEVDRLLREVRTRSRGEERQWVDALALSYRDASAAASTALRLLPSEPWPTAAPRAALDLSVVRSRAAQLLHQRRDAVARRFGSPAAAAERTATALSGGAAVLVLACLFLLAPRGTRHERRRDVEIAQLEAAARTDSLTGLGNLRSFHHDLSAAIDARTTSGSSFALMAVDVDGLKQVNDTRGHQAGDAYIRKVAEWLRQAATEHGTVYRTGGDEFAVLLPTRRTWHALAVARDVDQLARDAFGRRAVSIGITESISTEPRRLLIEQADTALYEAKRGDVSIVVHYPGRAGRPAVAGGKVLSHQEMLAAALARAVDAKDTGTRSHSETVAELAAAIGEQLGIGGERLQRLRRAGLLHDVGKIGVADAILKKTTSLDDDERAEMKAHVTIGHAVLKAGEMPLEATWVLHHHECCDGTGYPEGLRASEIPLESCILAVADAFEAMTGDRPYSTFMTPAQALAELKSHAGTQFDDRCVAALCTIVESTTGTNASGQATRAAAARPAARAVPATS
jgi:diguanylate cyclase (GGDEF)-like protein